MGPGVGGGRCRNGSKCGYFLDFFTLNIFEIFFNIERYYFLKLDLNFGLIRYRQKLYTTEILQKP